MFWDIFVKLCSEKNESPTSVVTKLGYSKGTVTHWKKGHTPQAVALRKVADYFSVSIEYLQGEEAPQKEKAPSKKEQGNDIMVGLFGGDKDIPPEIWEKVKDYAKFLMAEEDKKRGK